MFARYVITTICLLVWICSAAFSVNADSYQKIVDRLERLNGKRGFSVIKIGCSSEGRPIFAVIVDKKSRSNPNNNPKVRMLVLAGQHGDEPLPTHAVCDLIQSIEQKQPDALERVSIAFIPTVNPDGLVAKRRSNAAGADLNRDWLNPKQPETIAVTAFMNRYRPHVLIDQHEWVKDDPYRPNCIETASFGDQAHSRLARMLASESISGSKSTLQLKMTHYTEQSDPRMAHRRFGQAGICSMLIETSPDWPSDKRIGAYNEFIKSIFAALASPPSAIITNDLSVVKSKRPYSIACAEPDRKPKNGLPVWLAAFLTGAVFVLAKATAPKKMQEPLSNYNSARMLCFSEAVRSNSSLHARLELIHQLRVRPSDRPQKINSLD